MERMAPHLTHMGVHDHGFNNVSTYGTLWRLAREGRIDAGAWEVACYELALKVSGAVQARRWTPLPDGGFIHSFNGPHSLFVDTIRSLRSLALGFVLGQPLSEEQDASINLLDRLIAARARDRAIQRVLRPRPRSIRRARTRRARKPLQSRQRHVSRARARSRATPPSPRGPAALRGPCSASPRSSNSWKRCHDADLEPRGGREAIDTILLDAARATSDFYIDDATAADGVPYWDTGAPGLGALGDWRTRPADPFNPHEPVDSSAAAIAAQGLLRLGHLLATRGLRPEARRYEQAGLQVAATLFDETGPYLSRDPDHQGLVLHSVYHWPNGWDHVPRGATTPRNESSQWGDYHARELALYIKRAADGGPYLAFYGPRAAENTDGAD